MFRDLKGGSKKEVQGLVCNIPPVGYVFNTITGKLEKRQIISRSKNKSEQYWQREEIPKWVAQKEAEEEKKGIQSQELDEYINTEWDRRLNGIWFMNNGKPTYITGMHYFYLQWWCIDIGYPKFRIPDLEYFYFIQYCIEDPECMGMIEITKRRFGKSYRAGLFLYEYISRNERVYGGIQSKTNTDAKKFFGKTVISPFKKLPKFFRPQYDKAQGITPKTELRFRLTNVRGKKAEEALDVDELDSGIDYQSSDEVAYDGQKLYRYVRDEAGKTTEANVYDSHETIRYCLLDDLGKIIGKSLYTTTVEEMEKGGSNFMDLWKESDQSDIKENGRTTSGLYRFFMPSHRTREFDRYGFPDEQKTLKLIMLDRESVKNSSFALSARKRKEPLTIEEAFRIDGDKCMYDSELLNDRLEFLSWKENLTERGNFIYENGIRGSKVLWVKDRKGRFELSWNFKKPDESNKIEKRGTQYIPRNTLCFVAGADTFSHDNVKDNRRSNGAMVVKMRDNPALNDDRRNSFVCIYKYRAKTTSIQYEDMIMCATYFGCKILFESNKNSWKQYFIERGYEAFLMKLPNYPDYGIPGNQGTHQILAECTEEYIVSHSDLLFHKDQITDWLEFDISDTTKSDVAMASGYTLIADQNKMYSKREGSLKKISDYGFQKTKINYQWL